MSAAVDPGLITPEFLTLASLTSVKISQCITRFEDEAKKKSKHTAFIIALKTHGGLEWTVERRFSQFHQLNEVRGAAAPPAPALLSARPPRWRRPGPCARARSPARARAAPLPRPAADSQAALL